MPGESAADGSNGQSAQLKKNFPIIDLLQGFSNARGVDTRRLEFGKARQREMIFL